ncbi:MAG: glycosyltransferase family 2 protein [Prevotellaceae bacterium]|nr:glycosyltransferase [Prevotella sp.]MDD7257952.1 glycosyltransferase family 2 protein [Prevotellaceae bacterium]MDY6129863.1 glycosyltransferase family 2 protein [Prevotella sp.]
MIQFTVVTITYQAEHVLERTVESVLAQTYREVEHLIVDGNSKDGTLAVAASYKKRSDLRHNGHAVRIVSEPDRGLYDAMNKGLDMATGHYVVFLNAGDVFPHADTLHQVAQQAQAQPLPAVIYGDTDIVDNEGKFLHRRRPTPPEQLTWRSFRMGMCVCHQAFYARTDMARTIHYDMQYRYSADVDWCIRVMKEAEKRGLPMVNTHATLVNYLKEGQTTLHHRASLQERFRVMARHYGLASTLCLHAWFVARAVLRRWGVK